ncbi:membrane-anchored lipid-binding protein LAM4-like isoform X1 [Pieris napi]|uniref:membrane-anchored lipid-binding protein LAM4-like isoform X1 n=1 Tax=Pieris napi TaxID=78633 RepID=UPI001FBA85FD|nr:membrane-anchored lipid-binding protein LAM4-like isoform X1 [Pieris napi]
MRIKVRKSASFQECRHLSSATSDVSTSSSTSEGSDTPLRKFNRLLRSAVAGRWSVFKKQAGLKTRGRSVSIAGLCTIGDKDIGYIDFPELSQRSSLIHSRSFQCVPSLSFTSAGGSSSSHGLEEASDGSDADRPRRHLRVPSTVYPGQSTGNFSPGAGGGGGAPRSAPATPIQLEPQARASKHDKHVVKPLSGSAPSVRVGIAGSDDTTECKQPSKSRQKKFQRHFPQVGPEERVLNYYSCALVGDILLQGHLYITKNYFAFYSNVFGYVTKLLIPTSSVLRITKEKVARIIPNAVGVCTRDERHVFGSLLSRDATYKLMTLIWKSSKAPELAVPKSQDLRTPEVSEYSPEDDSSSGGADHVDSTQPARPEPEAIMAAASAAVIQPALLTGTTVLKRDNSFWHMALLALAALLTCSAMFLSYRLYCVTYRPHEWATSVSSEELYSELVRWRTRLHGRAANELHAFLSTNLLLLTKVRQSLEALSGVILTDMAEQGHRYADVPNDTLFS